MSNHTIIAVHETGLPINITFKYRAGRPARMYTADGDPGWPSDPAEVEYLNCDDQAFDTWAEAWLADHEDEAIELAEDEGP